MNLTPDDYRGTPINSRQGRPFEKWNSTGFITIQPLPQLHGKPWNELALGLVHALRPTQLRVIGANEGCQLDGQQWRVTVHLKEDDITIDTIDQEVTIGLPKGVAHGEAFRAAMKHGIDSDQVKWHDDDIESYYGDAKGNTFKIVKGKMIPYPK